MKRRGPPAPKRRRLPLVLSLVLGAGLAAAAGLAFRTPPVPPPPKTAPAPAVRGPVDLQLDEKFPAYEKLFAPKLADFEPAWRRAVLASRYGKE